MQDEIHDIGAGFAKALEESAPDEIRLLFMTREEAERITRAFLLQQRGVVDEGLIQEIVNQSEMKPVESERRDG